MKTGLKLFGLAIAFVTAIFWFFGGMNRAWTKTTVTRTEVDAVTQLEYPVVEKRFVPGIDFLAGGVGSGLFVAALSLLIRRQGPSGPVSTNPIA